MSMAPKACMECQKYSRAHGRCLEGMINPTPIRSVRQAMAIMGPSYICGKNPHKAKVVNEFYRKLVNR